VIEDNQSTNPGTVAAFSQVGRQQGHPGDHRPDPQHSDPGGFAFDSKGRHPTMIGGTDPKPDPCEQSVGVPLPPETIPSPRA